MLAVQDRLTEWAKVPKPENGIVFGDVEASLTRDTDPERVPVVAGSKFTWKDVP